ncbi:MAG: riboflavin biosynthesis protein RibF [Prevotella sp.]|nr:riboflavin biosynthesis protein RibF [Prevotella sp.]
MKTKNVEAAATIGFFDGVHRGHQYLVEQLRRLAAERNLLSTVITFDCHPRQVLHADWQPQLLSTLAEKQALLRQTGIDRLEVLHFDEEMAALSARDFMRLVLREQLGVGLLLTGYDNHFGHREQGCTEGFGHYVGYGRELGMEVVCGQPLVLEGVSVSSSLVRSRLLEGRVEEAARFLDRPYEISGLVEHGEQQGRRMGFPTANLHVATLEKLIPAGGVYAVRVRLDDDSRCWPGMTNIGLRPTFGEGHRQTIETHLFGFTGDLYGRCITLSFVRRLRDEQHFSSPEALARQMAIDAEQCKIILSK